MIRENEFLREILEVLSNTPATVAGLLQGLGEAWTAVDEGPDTFSPFDVVGHMIQGEKADWIPRARVILAHGESRPFEPFDRFAQAEANRGKRLADLLTEFAGLRRTNLDALRALELTEEMLAKRGTHPALGMVTLRELLATWVVHDLNHIAQICRVMARRVGDRVGPWEAYLPILGRRQG